MAEKITVSANFMIKHEDFTRDAKQVQGSLDAIGRSAVKTDKTLKATQRQLTTNQQGLRKFGMAAQQVSFAVEDFASQFGTMGFAGGLRAAGNNISFMVGQLNPLAGALTGLGIAAGQFFFDWLTGTQGAAKSTEELTDATREFIKVQKEARQERRQEQAGIEEILRADTEFEARQGADAALREMRQRVQDAMDDFRLMQETIANEIREQIAEDPTIARSLLLGFEGVDEAERARLLRGIETRARRRAAGAGGGPGGAAPGIITEFFTDPEKVRNAVEEIIALGLESEDAKTRLAELGVELDKANRALATGQAAFAGIGRGAPPDLPPGEPGFRRGAFPRDLPPGEPGFAQQQKEAGKALGNGIVAAMEKGGAAEASLFARLTGGGGANELRQQFPGLFELNNSAQAAVVAHEQLAEAARQAADELQRQEQLRAAGREAMERAADGIQEMLSVIRQLRDMFGRDNIVRLMPAIDG